MKLSEDPISIALVVASLVLLVLYFHEDSKLAELDAAEARAQAIDLGPLQDETCEAHAAGFEGAALVVRCEQSDDTEEIARLVAPAGDQAGFASIHVVAADDSLRCDLPFHDGSSCKNEQFQQLIE